MHVPSYGHFTNFQHLILVHRCCQWTLNDVHRFQRFRWFLCMKFIMIIQLFCVHWSNHSHISSRILLHGLASDLIPWFFPPSLLAYIVYAARVFDMYTPLDKNPSVWNFLSPNPEVTCGTVAVIIRVVLRIRGVSLSSIHYNQSHTVYMNRRQQYKWILTI
jgi:hypothetical protein